MVHIETRQTDRFRADRHDKTVERVAFSVDHDGVALDHALAVDDRDLLAFARRLDAAAHFEYDVFFALHHPSEVDLRFADRDSELRGIAHRAQHIGARKKRLRRNTAP